MSNLKIFSVESRKGGVGKTTVALALAQCLLDKEYQVLLLDLDVSGTALSETFCTRQGFICPVTIQGEIVNLIDLYKSWFLMGKKIPSFSFIRTSDRYLHVEKKKCNYLLSDIYSRGKDSAEPIEDPRVLNDSFHAFWMRKLLEELTSSFENSVGESGRAAIIIDNAPGFSAFENIVHEWLTTIGLNQCRFIMVASLDDQDMDASRQSVHFLKALVSEKVRGAKYYQSLLHGGDSVSNKTDAFEEVWLELCSSDGKYPTYYSEISNEPEIESYCYLLINKVPRSDIENLKSSVLSKRNEEMIPFLSHLQNLFSMSLTDLKNSGLSQKASLDSALILKGTIDSILADYQQFNDFLRCAKDRGHASFFSEKWSPLAPLLELGKQYREEPEVEKRLKKYLTPKRLKVCGDNSLDDYSVEIELVKGFVLSLRGSLKNTKYNEEVDDICKEVAYILKEAEDDKAVEFNTSAPSRVHLSGQIAHFGLAVYRLHYYQKLNELLIAVIRLYSEDTASFEQLNWSLVSDLLNDAMEGRKRLSAEFDKEWHNLFSQRINAFEIRKQLDSILEKWEI